MRLNQLFDSNNKLPNNNNPYACGGAATDTDDDDENDLSVSRASRRSRGTVDRSRSQLSQRLHSSSMMEDSSHDDGMEMSVQERLAGLNEAFDHFAI